MIAATAAYGAGKVWMRRQGAERGTTELSSVPKKSFFGITTYFGFQWFELHGWIVTKR